MIMDTNTILIFVVITIVIIFIIHQSYNQSNTQKTVENFQDEIKSVINPTKHDYKDNASNEIIVSIFNLINKNNNYTINDLFSFKEVKLSDNGNGNENVDETGHKKYLGHQVSLQHPEYNSNILNHHLYNPNNDDEYYLKEPTNLMEVYNFRKYDDSLKLENSIFNNNSANSEHQDYNYATKDVIRKLYNKKNDFINEKYNHIKIDNNGRNYFDFGKIKNDLILEFNNKINTLIDRNIVITTKYLHKKKYKIFTISSMSLRNYYKNQIDFEGEIEDFIENEPNLSITDNSVKLYYTVSNFPDKLGFIFKNLKSKIDESIQNKIKETSLFTEDENNLNFSLRNTDNIPQNHHLHEIQKPAALGIDILDTQKIVSNDHNWNYILKNAKKDRNNIRKGDILKNLNVESFYVRLDNTDIGSSNLNLNNYTTIKEKQLWVRVSKNWKGLKDLDIYFHNPNTIIEALNNKIDNIKNKYVEMNNFFKINEVLDKIQLKHGSDVMKKLSTLNIDEKTYFTSIAPSYTIYKPIPPKDFVCLGDVISKNSVTNNVNINKLKKHIMCIPKSCYLEVRSWNEKDRVATILNVDSKDPINITAVNIYVNPFTNTFRTTVDYSKNGDLPPSRTLPLGKVGRITKCPDTRKFDDIISLVDRHKTIVSNCKAEKEIDNSIPIKSNKFDAMEQSDYLNRIYQQEQRIKKLQKQATQMLLHEQNAEISKREKNRQDLQSHIEKQREVIERGLMKLKETQNQVEVNISYPMRVVRNVIEMVAESNQPVEKKIEVIKKLKEITDTPDYKEKIDRVLQSCPTLNYDDYWKRDEIPCYGCEL